MLTVVVPPTQRPARKATGGWAGGNASRSGQNIRWFARASQRMKSAAVKWGPVSLSNGVLYAASSAGFLQAWNADTGVPLAELPLAAGSFGGVSIATGRIFVNCGNMGGSGAVEAFETSG